MIVSTKYPDLVKFLFSSLRLEQDIPLQDGFLLARDLVNYDLKRLDGFENFVVISNYFAEQDWGRQEIVDYVTKLIRSRRKPKFDWMSDGEFIDAVKIYYICGDWPDYDKNAIVFELFKNIDTYRRVELYFALREDLAPYEIFYSVLTFIRRCFDDNTKFEVSPGYLRVIDSKKIVVKKNFPKAIRHFAHLGDIDQDFKTLCFINMIGELK